MNFALLASARGIFAAWGKLSASKEPRKNSFYINDFELKQSSPWVSFEHIEKFTSLESFHAFAQKEFLKYLPRINSWNLASEQNFKAIYDQTEKDFGENLKKILLSVCDTALRKDSEPLHKIPQADNCSFYSFYFEEEGIGAWGLTPELLFSTNGNEVKSVALAGTISQDNQNSARLEPEHNYVVDFFKDISEKNKLRMSFSREEAQGFGEISHLKTNIIFDTKDIFGKILSVEDWIALLHPTPALGVYPRNESTISYLRKSRSHLPSFFGAPFGFLSENSFEALVMIRGCFFDRERVYRPIGVGVTSFSTCSEEWNEIQAKRNAMEKLWNR